MAIPEHIVNPFWSKIEPKAGCVLKPTVPGKETGFGKDTKNAWKLKKLIESEVKAMFPPPLARRSWVLGSGPGSFLGWSIKRILISQEI